MAQLFYRYSVMSAGKSLELLKVRYNYLEKHRKVSTLTGKKGLLIDSRAGLSCQANASVQNEKELEQYLQSLIEIPDVILVDEAQFMSGKTIIRLARFVDEQNTPIICYGLKNDFQNHLFEGSQALLLYADKIEELKTICEFCTKKATMNLRLVDNKPVHSGTQVVYDDKDNIKYVSVCRKHYFSPVI